MTPTLLNNRYRIIQALGRGGFGETFLAEDTYLPSCRRCVIKRLKPVTAKPEVYQILQTRFAREAVILEALGEGNRQIPQLYAYFVENEYFYLVQELIEGLTLGEKLQKLGLFSEELIKEILINLLPVLIYIHSQGVIHRDIKPSNIILRQQDGKPVLIDFGIAKEIIHPVVDISQDDSQSIIVGTSGFMSPEQAMGKPTYASDIYSLGMTAIYLLTGRHPQDVVIDRQTGTGNELNFRIQDRLLAEVLQKSIQFHHRDRYPTAQAMLAALQPQDRIIFDVADTINPADESIYSQETTIKWDTQPEITPSLIPNFEIPNSTNSRQAYRNRQILINKVKNYWVKGVLETSLHGAALIALGLENRLDALEHPWGILWETPEQARQPLPPQTKIIDIFQKIGAGRSLLILGEPGAGKTTTLLELTHDLITLAENDINQPIPVVFNLSTWVDTKISITDWIIRELNTKYQVSSEISQTWIRNQQLLLLLDGLDEVSAERRDNCVNQINLFSQEYGGTEIVICSRIKDYEALSQRLNLQAAILIQPLAIEQIYQYLQSLGTELETLQIALRSDKNMQELAQSPLMLSIMTLAYQGMKITELPEMNLEERRQHIFDKYIQRMFERRQVKSLYSQSKSIHYLTWLAKNLKYRSQTVFLIERIQPNWLDKFWQKYIYITSLLLIFIAIGITIGIQLIPLDRVLLALGFTAIFFTLVFGFNQINPVETLTWSGKRARQHLIPGIFCGTVLGVMLKLTAATLYGFWSWQTLITYLMNLPIHGWFRGIAFGFSLGIIYVLIRGLTSPSIQTLAIPNQGIWQSGKNALIFGCIGFLILGLAAALLKWRIFAWGIFGFAFGVASGGGEACLKHLTLRLILYTNGYIPWNYARFLDYATERIFLQKVGGGYIFVHRLLLEHFAQMETQPWHN